MLGAPSETLRQLAPGGAPSTAAAALRFVLANPGVTTACSGMSSRAQLDENVRTVGESGSLSAAEHERMRQILDEYRALGESFCTGCKYCMPCPHGVDIPANFHLYNYHKVYGFSEWAKAQYAGMKPECRADQCNRCGECEAKCPQKVPIREQLATVAAQFGKP